MCHFDVLNLRYIVSVLLTFLNNGIESYVEFKQFCNIYIANVSVISALTLILLTVVWKDRLSL